MLRLFSKRKVTVEAQLAALRECGIELSPDARIDDLLGYEPRDQMERVSYTGILPALGADMEREPFLPLCSCLWLCDYERIENMGAYVEVVKRLELMSGGSLTLSDITDYVVLYEIKDSPPGVWVEFSVHGERSHWDAVVDNDWLDPCILVKFDALLAATTNKRIYSNHTSFGQSALLGCFTPEQFARFAALSQVTMRVIAEQA